MSANLETLDAVIAEMDAPKDGENAYMRLTLQEYAYRLKAAHRRELAALRDAVIAARRLLAVWGDELPFRVWNEKGEVLDKCDAALREGGAK